MAETRPPKRRKSSPPPQSQLMINRLNSLSACAFCSAYVPSELLKFASPKSPNLSFTLEFHTGCNLPAAYFRKCFDLVRYTSEAHYRVAPSRGWNPREKKAELKDNDMKFLIVQHDNKSSLDASVVSSSDNLSSISTNQRNRREPRSTKHAVNVDEISDFGFLSFKLDVDGIEGSGVVWPVLYIYEIHLDEGFRGVGLGKHLMRVAKHIATATQVDRLVLSVFTCNESAIRFYGGLGWVTDETSPEPRYLRGKIIEPDWKALKLPIARTDSSEEPKPKKRAVLQHISNPRIHNADRQEKQVKEFV
jgi:N-alpha-acetyltransferase 40